MDWSYHMETSLSCREEVQLAKREREKMNMATEIDLTATKKPVGIDLYSPRN